MEFWGVEVPSGKPLTCQPGPSSYVHVSQAALGDSKNVKGNERVVLKVKVGANEVVVGTLTQGKCDQTTLDLIFEKDFVLSHNSSGSVYFCGYKTDAVRDDEYSSGSEDEELETLDEDEDEETALLLAKENGRMLSIKPDKAAVPVNKAVAAKSSAPKVEVPVAEGKSKAKHAVAVKSKGAVKKSDDDDDDDDDEDEDDEEDDSDEENAMMVSSSDDEDLDSDEEDESEDDESEEEKPKPAMKKRHAALLESGNAGKKVKADTPGKAESKTPSLPSSTPKQQQSGKKDQSAKKTPGKENVNTPASGKKLGQFFCQPCSKNFNSESALSQHKTAKHKS